MKKLIFVLAAVLAFASCKKDEQNELPAEPCQTFNMATVRVTNNSDNPYNLFNSDVFLLTIAGKNAENVSVGAGSVHLKLVQVSGYIFTPTIYETKFNITACESISWQP